MEIVNSTNSVYNLIRGYIKAGVKIWHHGKKNTSECLDVKIATRVSSEILTLTRHSGMIKVKMFQNIELFEGVEKNVKSIWKFSHKLF